MKTETSIILITDLTKKLLLKTIIFNPNLDKLDVYKGPESQLYFDVG